MYYEDNKETIYGVDITFLFSFYILEKKYFINQDHGMLFSSQGRF